MERKCSNYKIPRVSACPKKEEYRNKACPIWEEEISFIKQITRKQSERLSKSIVQSHQPDNYYVKVWQDCGLAEKPKTAMDELEQTILSSLNDCHRLIKQGYNKLDSHLVCLRIDDIKRTFDKVKEKSK
jgi:hypothetical protein